MLKSFSEGLFALIIRSSIVSKSGGGGLGLLCFLGVGVRRANIDTLSIYMLTAFGGGLTLGSFLSYLDFCLGGIYFKLICSSSMSRTGLESILVSWLTCLVS